MSHVAVAHRPGAPGAPGKQVLSLVERYIEEHYVQDLRLTSVAGAVSVSPYYISHLFRRERGTTFLKHLTAVRLAHAERYLLETDLPVEKIAEHVGYPNPKRFRVVFKRTFDTTPSQYRRGYADARRSLGAAG